MLLKYIVITLLFINIQVLAKDNLQFSAFGTLGVVTSDSDRYGYRPDVTYDRGVFSGDIDLKSHSLLGMQLDASLSENLDFAGQFVLKDLAETNFEHYITMGFLRYSPNPNWQFRLGRIPPDIFLITEYRDVNFAYTWANVPSEVYGLIPFKFIDGGDISYIKRFEGGTFYTKLFTGSGHSQVSASVTQEDIDIEDAYGLSLSFETIDWTIQARHTRVKIANENQGSLEVLQGIRSLPSYIWPSNIDLSNDLLLKGKHANYSSLSGQTYLSNYLLTTELARIASSDSQVLPDIFSGYISLAYLKDEHTFYSIFSFTDSDNYQFDEPGVQKQFIPEIIQGIESINNFYASNQQTLSLGWRWNINSNIASKIQWNRTHIKDNGGTLWINKSLDTSDETVNVLMLSVSFTL